MAVTKPLPRSGSEAGQQSMTGADGNGASCGKAEKDQMSLESRMRRAGGSTLRNQYLRRTPLYRSRNHDTRFCSVSGIAAKTLSLSSKGGRKA